MEKFQGKYRIPSARLQTWNYGWNGAYFITICTKDRINYFGKIIDGTMQLSHIGIVADIIWYEIKHHAQNINLGDFVVMPNHIHGILILNDRNNNHDGRDKRCDPQPRSDECRRSSSTGAPCARGQSSFGTLGQKPRSA